MFRLVWLLDSSCLNSNHFNSANLINLNEAYGLEQGLSSLSPPICVELLFRLSKHVNIQRSNRFHYPTSITIFILFIECSVKILKFRIFILLPNIYIIFKLFPKFLHKIFPDSLLHSNVQRLIQFIFSNFPKQTFIPNIFLHISIRFRSIFTHPPRPKVSPRHKHIHYEWKLSEERNPQERR